MKRKRKIHYVDSDYKLWNSYKTLCGIKLHFLEAGPRAIYENGSTRKVTCMNCKRILKACKKKKK